MDMWRKALGGTRKAVVAVCALVAVNATVPIVVAVVVMIIIPAFIVNRYLAGKQLYVNRYSTTKLLLLYVNQQLNQIAVVTIVVVYSILAALLVQMVAGSDSNTQQNIGSTRTARGVLPHS